jgi:hypothetical protein
MNRRAQDDLIISRYRDVWIIKKEDIIAMTKHIIYNEAHEDMVTFRLLVYIPSLEHNPLKIWIYSPHEGSKTVDRVLLSDQDMMAILHHPEWGFIDRDLLMDYLQDFKRIWLRFMGVTDADWIDEHIQFKQDILLNEISTTLEKAGKDCQNCLNFLHSNPIKNWFRE